MLRPPSATLLLAHAEGGLGDAGLSSPLILFVSVSMLVLVAVGLRATWATARFGSGTATDDGESDSDSPGPNALTIAGRALLLALLVLVLLIGFGGSPTSGANPVPPAVYSVFWYGGLLLAILFGDVWAAVNPAIAIAEVLDRARGRSGDIGARSRPGPLAEFSGVPVGAGREATPSDDPDVVYLDPSTGRSVDVATIDRGGPGRGQEGPTGPARPTDTEGGGRDDGTVPGDVWWLPAVLLIGFVVLWICWPGGVRPRPTATYVAIWAAVMVVGGAVHGPRWVRRHDPFGLLFSAVAGCSPVRWPRRRAGRSDTAACGGAAGRFPREAGDLSARVLRGEATLTGPARHLASRIHEPTSARVDLATAAVLTVSLGATVFDGVRVTQWWSELIGPRSLTSLGIVNTFALIWIIVTVAAVWMTATRAIDRLTDTGETDDDATRLTLAFAPALAAIVVVSRLASDLDRFQLSSQNLLSLASDPFANGADLLGTVDWTDHPILSPLALAWTGLALMLAGHLVALVAVHDRTVAWFGATVAARSIWPLTGFLVLSLAVALQLLGI